MESAALALCGEARLASAWRSVRMQGPAATEGCACGTGASDSRGLSPGCGRVHELHARGLASQGTRSALLLVCAEQQSPVRNVMQARAYLLANYSLAHQLLLGRQLDCAVIVCTLVGMPVACMLSP
jgi:hypothetical protein